MLRWIKKWVPRKKDVEQEKSLNWLHRHILHPGLWKFHRDSVSKGVAIGLFVNFLPIPLQMMWASVLAILLRANLPTSVALTWINNPFTFIPINILIYKTGGWVVGGNAGRPLPPEWSGDTASFHEYWADFIAWIPSVGMAYLIGLVIISIGSAIVGYLLIQLIFVLYAFFIRHERIHPKE